LPKIRAVVLAVAMGDLQRIVIRNIIVVAGEGDGRAVPMEAINGDLEPGGAVEGNSLEETGRAVGVDPIEEPTE